MGKNFGALIVVAIGGELIGEIAFFIEIADFICRHDGLRKALSTYPACPCFARTARECRMTFELQLSRNAKNRGRHLFLQISVAGSLWRPICVYGVPPLF